MGTSCSTCSKNKNTFDTAQLLRNTDDNFEESKQQDANTSQQVLPKIGDHISHTTEVSHSTTNTETKIINHQSSALSTNTNTDLVKSATQSFNHSTTNKSLSFDHLPEPSNDDPHVFMTTQPSFTVSTQQHDMDINTSNPINTHQFLNTTKVISSEQQMAYYSTDSRSMLPIKDDSEKVVNKNIQSYDDDDDDDDDQNTENENSNLEDGYLKPKTRDSKDNLFRLRSQDKWDEQDITQMENELKDQLEVLEIQEEIRKIKKNQNS